MAKQKSTFSLPEKDEFSRDNLEELLVGKIVSIFTSGTESLGGKLIYYKPGDIAILSPYITIAGDQLVIRKGKRIVEEPKVVSEYEDCKTVKDLLEKYFRPSLEKAKEQAKKEDKK